MFVFGQKKLIMEYYCKERVKNKCLFSVLFLDFCKHLQSTICAVNTSEAVDMYIKVDKIKVWATRRLVNGEERFKNNKGIYSSNIHKTKYDLHTKCEQ